MTTVKWLIAFAAPFFGALAASPQIDSRAWIVAAAAGFAALAGMTANKGIDKVS